MELPERKQNRLSCFDYRNPGYYFITICTKNKERLFWISSDLEESNLSYIGQITQQCIFAIPQIYPTVHLNKFVIMPNHVHLILYLEEKEQHSDGPSISSIVGQMKRIVSKKAKKEVWQRSFHDHIIRNEMDYQMIWKYIEDNPRKWKEDCFYNE